MCVCVSLQESNYKQTKKHVAIIIFIFRAGWKKTEEEYSVVAYNSLLTAKQIKKFNKNLGLHVNEIFIQDRCHFSFFSSSDINFILFNYSLVLTVVVDSFL